MSLRYTCPGCGTPLGYNGLSRKCKCEQERKNLRSMQELKTAKELCTPIAGEKSLDTLRQIKERPEGCLPEEPGRDKKRRTACGGMNSGPSVGGIPGTAAARSSRRHQKN